EAEIAEQRAEPIGGEIVMTEGGEGAARRRGLRHVGPRVSNRSTRRKAGKSRPQASVTTSVRLPPIITAATAPSRAAALPATKVPSSFEAPMKTASTATTRPRRASGVANGTNVPRM